MIRPVPAGLLINVIIISKCYGGKRVSLDPLRPTPLLAGLPPAGAHCSTRKCKVNATGDVAVQESAAGECYRERNNTTHFIVNAMTRDLAVQHIAK